MVMSLGKVHWTSRGESVIDTAQPWPMTPRETSGGSYQDTKCNQYLPMGFTSLNVTNSRFLKDVMFWMWRHYGMVLWRHSGGARHNALFLMTASNVKSWTDIANDFTQRGLIVASRWNGKFRTTDYRPAMGLITGYSCLITKYISKCAVKCRALLFDAIFILASFTLESMSAYRLLVVRKHCILCSFTGTYNWH